VAFGTPGQTGADFREQTSYDVSLGTPLPVSQASTDPVNNELSTFSYNTDHDLTAVPTRLERGELRATVPV
jgi:hypothetical protein